MKKLLCLLVISATLAACGNNASNTNGSDTSAPTTISPDSSHMDSTGMKGDTTHKDSVVH